MYIVMFLNVEEFSHVYSSLTRMYMTFLMVAPMVILKLMFMWKMYPNKELNYGIATGSIGVFILFLFLLRTQTPIGDLQYMKAMIPHHSSAIMTSSNAKLEDEEVRKLADEIIEAQVKEINEMKAMIQRLESAE